MSNDSNDRRYILLTYAAALAVAAAIVWRLELAPIVEAAIADLAATAVVFISSVRADNSSVYDPYWSVAPPFLIVYWILESGETPAAMLLTLGLVLVWAVRLTANWALRWRGLEDEDWRYREFRRRSGKWYWPVSLSAIHLFPTVSVFAGLLPVALATRAPTEPTALFAAGVVVAGSSIFLEALADRQLRAHRRSDADGPCRSGVWSLSSHPNYVGELGFWLGIFLLGAGSGAPWWSILGFVVMCGIFLGYSIPAMDRHLAEKWQEYPGDATAIDDGTPNSLH